VKAHFMFAVLVSAALLRGVGDGDRAATDKRPAQTGHGSATPQMSGRVGPARAKLPSPVPKRPTHVPSAGATGPLRSPDGPSPAAMGGLTRDPMAGRRSTVRLPGPVKAAAPPLSNVRHRSPNPAVIGGVADLGKRNTGAINGRQVPRRP
jgi:hypothetical protein